MATEDRKLRLAELRQPLRHLRQLVKDAPPPVHRIITTDEARDKAAQNVKTNWRVYRYQREPNATAVPLELLIQALETSTQEYMTFITRFAMSNPAKNAPIVRELMVAVMAMETLAYTGNRNGMRSVSSGLGDDDDDYVNVSPREARDDGEMFVLTFVDWKYMLFVKPKACCMGCGKDDDKNKVTFKTCEQCNMIATCPSCLDD